MAKLILATTSPYRKETFQNLDIPFEAVGSNVDESQAERKSPQELVKELSRLKAEAVAKDYPNAVVIGMDSVGCFNNRILGKPKSKEEAFQRLKALSGRNHQFYTGVHIINTASDKVVSRIVVTEVFIREISEEEISKYLDEDPRFNTYALGYDPVKHISSSFVRRIEGSYYNLLGGIPIETIVEMLKEVGHKNDKA